LIDRRELLEKAKERGLNLLVIEKDYALGWLLYGFSKTPNLVFKGGTALSKIYFPKIWRLSEDLDFSCLEEAPEFLLERMPAVIKEAEGASGIEFILRTSFSNPDYLQLKIQYVGIIGRNWVKVDVMKNDLVEPPIVRQILAGYSDSLPFDITVETLEEIFASKLRAAIERKKCRDYFDLWKLTKLEFDRGKLKRVFTAKLAVKGIEFEGTTQLLPPDIKETLHPYWERELGRLLHPAPNMEKVLKELSGSLGFLDSE